MVRRREETKRDHLKMTVNIFEKRVEIRDFNGAVYSELNAQYKNTRYVSIWVIICILILILNLYFYCRPVYNPLYTNQYSQGAQASGTAATGALLAAGGVLPGGILAAGGAGNTTVYAQGPQYLNSSSLGMGKW